MSNFEEKTIIEKISEWSKRKTKLSLLNLVLLGILAGLYIGIGGFLSIVAGTGTASHLGYGATKIIGGIVFSLGLILVVFVGAELFTGNNLMVVGLLKKEIKLSDLIKNWLIVFLANFAGSILLAFLIYKSGLLFDNHSQLGITAVKIAANKTSLDFMEAFTRGILANWLVCLAVWIVLSSKSTLGKVVGIIFPIAGFVAAGFEHSVANMFLIPLGLFSKSNFEVMLNTGDANIFNLNMYGFLIGNLLPVTLGNIVGGALFVGAIYFVIHKNKNV